MAGTKFAYRNVNDASSYQPLMRNMEENDVLSHLKNQSFDKRSEVLEKLRAQARRNGGRLPFPDQRSVFQALNTALCDTNWDVRHQCIQLLHELIPSFGDDLDECMSIVLEHLIPNIGDSKITVRRAVIQTIHVYMKYTGNIQELFHALVRYGLENRNSRIKKEMVISLPMVFTPEFSQENMFDITQALAKCLLDSDSDQGNGLRNHALLSLQKIKKLVGDGIFTAYLQKLSAPLRRYYHECMENQEELSENNNQPESRGNAYSTHSTRSNGHIKAFEPYSEVHQPQHGSRHTIHSTSDLEFGIVPGHIMDKLNDQSNFRARAQGVEELKLIIKDLDDISVLHPHILNFVSFLNNLLDDANFKITTVTLEILGLLVTKLSYNVQPHLKPLVLALCKRMGDNKIVVRQAIMKVGIQLMQILSPKDVLTVICENLTHRNSRVRQETLNIVIRSLLTFPSYEFDLGELCQKIAHTLIDPKRQVRQASLECFSVLAQAMGAGKLQPLVQAVDSVELSFDGDGVMAAVQSRLARRQLPRVNADGLIDYATPIPSSAASSRGSAPAGADIDWILMASGSAGSSARSARSDIELESITSGSARSTPVHIPESPVHTPRGSGRHLASASRRNKLPWDDESDPNRTLSPGSPCSIKSKATTGSSDSRKRFISPEKRNISYKERFKRRQNQTSSIWAETRNSILSMNFAKRTEEKLCLFDEIDQRLESAMSSMTSITLSKHSFKPSRSARLQKSNDEEKRSEVSTPSDDKRTSPNESMSDKLQICIEKPQPRTDNVDLKSVSPLPNKTQYNTAPTVGSTPNSRGLTEYTDMPSVELTGVSKPEQEVSTGFDEVFPCSPYRYKQEETESLKANTPVNDLYGDWSCNEGDLANVTTTECAVPNKVVPVCAVSLPNTPSPCHGQLERVGLLTPLQDMDGTEKDLDNSSLNCCYSLNSNNMSPSPTKMQDIVKLPFANSPRAHLKPPGVGHIPHFQVLPELLEVPTEYELSDLSDGSGNNSTAPCSPKPLKPVTPPKSPFKLSSLRRSPLLKAVRKTRPKSKANKSPEAEFTEPLPQIDDGCRPIFHPQSLEISNQNNPSLSPFSKADLSINITNVFPLGECNIQKDVEVVPVDTTMSPLESMEPASTCSETPKVERLPPSPNRPKIVINNMTDIQQDGTIGNEKKSSRRKTRKDDSSPDSSYREKNTATKPERTGQPFSVYTPKGEEGRSYSTPSSGTSTPRYDYHDEASYSKRMLNPIGASESAVGWDDPPAESAPIPTKPINVASRSTSSKKKVPPIAARQDSYDYIDSARENTYDEDDYRDNHPDPTAMHKIRNSATKKKVNKIFNDMSTREQDDTDSGFYSKQTSRDDSEPTHSSKKSNVDNPFGKKPKRVARSLSGQSPKSETPPSSGSDVDHVQFQPNGGVSIRGNKNSDVAIVGKGYSDDNVKSPYSQAPKPKERRKPANNKAALSPLGVANMHGHGQVEVDDEKLAGLVGKGMFDGPSPSNDQHVNGNGQLLRPERRSSQTDAPNPNEFPRGVYGISVRKDSLDDEEEENAANISMSRSTREHIQKKMQAKKEEESKKREEERLEQEIREREAERQRQEKVKEERERQQQKLRRLSGTADQGLDGSLAVAGNQQQATATQPQPAARRKPPPKRNTRPAEESPPVSHKSVESEDVSKPYKDPQRALDESMKIITKDDWETKMSAITSLRRLVQHHPEVVQNQLHPVTIAVLNEIKNLRSQVSRLAIVCLGDFFQYLKRAMDVDLDQSTKTLLSKAGESNAFIRDDVDKSLQSMVDNTTANRAAVAIIAGGASRNKDVKRTAAHFLGVLVERMGPGRVLSGVKDITDKILPTAAQFLLDGSPETRYAGQKIMYFLMSHEDFDRQITKHVPANTLRNVQDKLDNLKRKGLGEPPSSNASATRRSGIPRSGSQTRHNSAAESASSKRRSAAPRIDDATMEEVKSMGASMSANDWRERQKGIIRLQDMCQSSPNLVNTNIVKIFDHYTPTLKDSNAKVNLFSLQVLCQITPTVKDHMSNLVTLVLQNVSANLSSKNKDIHVAATEVLDSFMEHVDPVLLLQPFCAISQTANSRIKPDMIERVSYLVTHVYPQKPKQIKMYALPLLWHLLSTANGSGATQGASGSARSATSNLVQSLFHQMGPTLMEQAQATSTVSPRMLQQLQDLIEHP